jgi:endonuclease YncB( thermonuclease family)
MSAFFYAGDNQVLRVLDGDTLRVTLDAGLGVTITTNLRLAGVNAAELKTGKAKEAGAAAAAFLTTLLAAHANVVRVKSLKWDKYAGRVIAFAWLPDGRSVVKELIDGGFIRDYYDLSGKSRPTPAAFLSAHLKKPGCPSIIS